MKRRDFLRNTILCLLTGQVGRYAEATGHTDNRLTVAASNGRKFLAHLFDQSLGLLPEYEGAKVYWLYHDNYLVATVG